MWVVAIVSVVLMGILIVISFIGGIVGGISSCRQNDATGVLGIIFGSVFIMLSVVGIIAVITVSVEKTEKIAGKGTITKLDDIDYIDGRGVSSDEIIFYLLMKNGDKIIVDKAVWEKTETEFSYRETEVEKIKE